MGQWVTVKCVTVWNHPFALNTKINKSCHCVTYFESKSTKVCREPFRKSLFCIITEQTICQPGAVTCIPASTEASCALALPRDVVAHSTVTTGTVFAAVDAVLAKRAGLGTYWPLWKQASTLNWCLDSSDLLLMFSHVFADVLRFLGSKLKELNSRSKTKRVHFTLEDIFTYYLQKGQCRVNFHRESSQW